MVYLLAQVIDNDKFMTLVLKVLHEIMQLEIMISIQVFKSFFYIILPTGCFISGLEYSASTTAEVVGKPQKSFFLSALAKLNQLYGKTLKPEGKLLILNFTFFYKKKCVIYSMYLTTYLVAMQCTIFFTSCTTFQFSNFAIGMYIHIIEFDCTVRKIVIFCAIIMK